MKNFNMLMFWLAFFLFVIFFASNSITRPQIFFLGNLIGTMGIVYVAIIGIFMGWGLKGMLSGRKGGNDYENENDEGF